MTYPTNGRGFDPLGEAFGEEMRFANDLLIDQTNYPWRSDHEVRCHGQGYQRQCSWWMKPGRRGGRSDPRGWGAAWRAPRAPTVLYTACCSPSRSSTTSETRVTRPTAVALEPKLHGAPQQAAALLAAPDHASAQAALRPALADMLGGSGGWSPSPSMSPKGLPAPPRRASRSRTERHFEPARNGEYLYFFFI